MNIFEALLWLNNYTFYSKYMKFGFMLRIDGYFNITDFILRYKINQTPSQLYQIAKKTFRIDIDNDIIEITDGQEYDGVYIHWYYITTIIYILFPNLRHLLRDLINVNYKDLSLATKLQDIKKKIEIINIQLDTILLLKVKNIVEKNKTPIEETDLLYEKVLSQEKNKLQKLYKNFFKTRLSVIKKQHYLINKSF